MSRVPSRRAGVAEHFVLVAAALGAFLAGFVIVTALDLTPAQRIALRWMLASLAVGLWLAGLALRWRDRRSGPTVDG